MSLLFLQYGGNRVTEHSYAVLFYSVVPHMFKYPIVSLLIELTL